MNKKYFKLIEVIVCRFWAEYESENEIDSITKFVPF